jgi:hypothetical protein
MPRYLRRTRHRCCSKSPIVVQLTTRQQAHVRQVIDGMLRERSDGSPGAVLRNPMNIAVGIKR